MFSEFFKRGNFYNSYFILFNIRQSAASFQMENIIDQMAKKDRTVELYNNLNAFDSLMKSNIDKISPYDLIEVADNINKNVNFFDRGFRKVDVMVAKAKNFYPINHERVPEAIYSLFNCYHNVWKDLPVYEKEARLHTKIVRIQPFEDGNKRVAKIITNYNLCKQNKAPLIINDDEIDEYFSYIDNNDIKGLSNFFERKSKEEFENMLELYETLYKTNDISMCEDDNIFGSR